MDKTLAIQTLISATDTLIEQIDDLMMTDAFLNDVDLEKVTAHLTLARNQLEIMEDDLDESED